MIFVVIDTLRADYLGCYNGIAKTPNIDKIAQKGILFRNAFSASDFTAPSFMSIFSGLYPSEHGMIDWSKKSKKLPLMEYLSNNEYKVKGFTSFRFIKQLLQESIDIESSGIDFGNYWDVNQHLLVTEKSIKFIDDNKNKKFFLFYHQSAPHIPYKFPKNKLNILTKDKEFEHYFKIFKSDKIINAIFPQLNKIGTERLFKNDGEALKNSSILANLTTRKIKLDEKQIEFIRFLYKKEVELTDKLFGMILNKINDLSLQKDTIICFLADHGELLFEHNQFGHANDFLYNEVLRIPFIIYNPNFREKLTIEKNVSHINVMPTLLDMLGIKLTEKIKKRSLWDEISKNKQIVSRPVYSEGKFRVAVIKNNIKYITDSKRETQILSFRSFILKSLKILQKKPDTMNELRNNFIKFSQPYYKRLKGASKEELIEFDTIENVEKPIKKNSFLKKEIAKLIDEYYNMEKVDLIEKLSEEDLRIIKVRLEALGYLIKNKK